MKIIAALLLSFSSFVMAQSPIKIGEDVNGIYRVKKDSFATYKEKEGNYVSLTIQMILKNQTKPVGLAHFKMLEQDCLGDTKFNLYRTNEYDTEIISTHITKFNENNLYSVISTAICNYSDEVKENPNINKTSTQSLSRYAQFAPDNEWSIPMILGENKFLTLTNSIKFEEQYVSIIAKLQFPARTTEYYKLYIDRDFCVNQKGYFEMRTLDTLTSEMDNIPFDLKKTPDSKDIKAVHFHNIAKTMCEYTMNNFQFKKRIIIPESSSLLKGKGTMFDRD